MKWKNSYIKNIPNPKKANNKPVSRLACMGSPTYLATQGRANVATRTREALSMNLSSLYKTKILTIKAKNIKIVPYVISITIRVYYFLNLKNFSKCFLKPNPSSSL